MPYTGNWVTPYHKDSDFSDPPTDDEKVTIFADRVDGWQLKIAEEMLKQIETGKPGDVMQHAAYAMTSVVFSYFEMVGQIVKKQAGECFPLATGDFIRGFRSVFPMTRLTDDQIKAIYDRIRCGMYHNGYTKRSVHIDGDYPDVVAFDNNVVKLNPHKLVPAIRVHFSSFVTMLRDRANVEERLRFVTLFGTVGRA